MNPTAMCAVITCSDQDITMMGVVAIMALIGVGIAALAEVVMSRFYKYHHDDHDNSGKARSDAASDLHVRDERRD